MKINITNAEHVKLLQTEIVKVFPDAVGYVTRGPIFPHCNGLSMGYYQAAYHDISWGWYSDDSIIKAGRDRTVRPCPLGGIFVRDVTNIGD